MTAGGASGDMLHQLAQSLPPPDGGKLGNTVGGPSCQVCAMSVHAPLKIMAFASHIIGHACTKDIIRN